MITLQLTNDEAAIMDIILDYIGGCPRTSGRKHTDDIHMKLRKAGFKYEDGTIARFPMDEEYADRAGIYFKGKPII